MDRCEQCGKKTPALIMSMYSTKQICLDCKAEEERRPSYQEAVKREVEAIKRGDKYFNPVSY